MEAFAIGCADMAITSSEGFRRVIARRGIEESKIRVLREVPEPLLAVTSGPTGERAGGGEERGVFRLVCRDIPPRPDSLDTAFRALSLVRGGPTEVRLEVLLEGGAEPRVDRPFLSALGITGIVGWHEALAQHEALAVLRTATAALLVGEHNDLEDNRLPRSVFEHLALGLPVIAPRFPILVEVFGADGLLYYDPGREEDLARAIREAIADPDRRRGSVLRGRAASERLLGPGGGASYLSLVQGLWEETAGLRPTTPGTATGPGP
jgi:glycosyltransferase involved in cell wall biosynthesis